MGEPQVKGMAILNSRAWLDARLGAGWFVETARAHDPEFPERILPGEWYAVRTHQFVYERAFEALEGYASCRELMQAATVEVALNDLNGILRAFLWAASPKMFLRTVPKVWETYADFTGLEILRNDTGHFEARVFEIPADVREWVAAAWAGFLPPALELAGGKEPQATIRDLQPTAGMESWELICEIRYG